MNKKFECKGYVSANTYKIKKTMARLHFSNLHIDVEGFLLRRMFMSKYIFQFRYLTDDDNGVII